MLDATVQTALNRQVNAELYSAYLYLSMAARFDAANLRGVAHWFKVQAQEETGHAMKFYGYIVERGGRVSLQAIEAPPAEWKTPLAAFEAAYAHEVKVSGLIHGLVALAREKKDFATENFLQWFVAEQVEEEAAADEIVQNLKMIGDATAPLLMYNQVLGQRKAG